MIDRPELGSSLTLQQSARSSNQDKGPTKERKAALRIAAQIAAEHPEMTASEIAADPLLAQGLRKLLADLFGPNYRSICQGDHR